MFFRTVSKEIYHDITIPSLFFDRFLPISTGNQIRVYLFGYRNAFFYNGFNSENINNNTISKTLNIEENEVLEIWRYWEENNLVKIHKSDKDFIVEFLDLKSAYIDRNEPSSEEYSNIDEIVNTSSSVEYINMYNEIESIAGRILTPNEKIELSNSLKSYEMTPILLVEAFKRAVSESGRIKSIRYIVAILKSWFDNSVKSIEDLEKIDSERSSKNDNYKLVFNNLGFYRNPTPAEKKIIDKWFYEYNMSSDLVLKACSKSINVSNPTINYFDKILSKWHSSGIKTVEDVDLEEKKFAESKNNKSTTNNTKKTSEKAKVKTKFHNFEHGTSNTMSEDEYRALIRRINKSK